MKSAIVFALAIVPALTGILEAAEPLGPPQVATTLRESLPPEPAAKKPAGPPIELVIRVYEMDTKKLGPSLDFSPIKDNRKTINAQFEASRKAGWVRVLAEPHLVTQDGRPATFLSGGEVPVIIPTGKGAVALDWHEFGTRVDVTPRRTEQGHVHLKIAAEFSRLAEHGLSSEKRTNPIIVGRSIRTAATLGPQDIVVLNDRETRESDEPGKVVFMTVELANVGVESALLQFDGQDGEGDLPVPPRDVPARVVPNRRGPSVEPPIATGGQPADLPGEVGTGGVTVDGTTGSQRYARPARKNSAASSKASFYLKPGKTQLELTRGTWRSLTIPSKDFVYGSSLLVESPEDGAVLISGRNMTPVEDGPAKTESFEAGESGEQYAAEIWTIRGVKAGIATIRLLDDNDQEYELEVTVKGDTRHFDAMVKRFHPKANVEAHELTAESIVITGEATPEDSVAIREIAEQLYETVLLRLKTQTVPGADLEGDLDTGVGNEEAGTTGPVSDTVEKGSADRDAFAPATTTGDSNADPSPLDVNDTPDDDDNPSDVTGEVFRAGSGGPVSIAQPGVSEEGYGETGYDVTPPNAVGVTVIKDETGQNVTAVVGVRASSQPAVATTQIRFLHTGSISMQTPAEPGSFQKVHAWDSMGRTKRTGGRYQQVPYSAHSENIPQGSQTRLQFRTTEFRDDVWVNAVLLTAAANEKTRFHLQHFPVELELQAHEVVAAARGALVTRYVVLKDPNRAPVRTKEGETEEPRESFTGPNSFDEAIAESRKHGELLAVLVLGPESKLQRGFTLPRSAQVDRWEQELGLYSNQGNPYGEDANYKNPKSVNTPAEIPTDEASSWQPQPAGSVSTEMRQLRQEVRSLREQLGKLVEVLSQENRTKPGVDHPVPVPVDSNTDPIDRGTEGGPDTGNGTGSTNRSTSVPSLFPEDLGTETLPPPIRLFESETGLITPETTTRKPSLKPRPKPVRGETLPVESEVIPQPESRPVPVKEIPVPSTEAN